MRRFAMKIREIREMRDREPFRPFHLHLANGETLPVNHPELLSISPDVDDLFTLWVGPKWNLIEMTSVVRLRVATKAHKRP